jgi:hypothetical protein
MNDFDIKYLNKLFPDNPDELDEDEDEIDPFTGEKKKNYLNLDNLDSKGEKK